MSVPSNLIPVAITGLPNDPAPSDQGFLAYSRAGTTYKVQVADILNYSGVPVTRQVLAGTGLTGGGQLTSNVTLSVAVGGIGPTQLANTGVAAGTYGDASNAVTFSVDAQGRITSISTSPIVISGYVPVTRQVIAGVGLTGGGALSGNVTLSADLSASTPLAVDTTGSAGVSNEMSRSDHTHPAIDLADDDQVDGLLGLDNGGTGRSLVANAGAIVYSGADGLYVGSAGTTGQVLVSNGSAGYTWGTAVLLSDQPANVFYAGPAAGPDAPVAFRTIVNADLPNSGVSANTYGSSSLIPVITVNAKGVVTGVTTQSIVSGVSSVNGQTGAVTLTASDVGAPSTTGSGASGTWSISVTGSSSTSTNVAGGAANQIVFNTAASTTSFVAAPTVANTFLEWSGSAFQWSANPLGSVTSVDVSGGTTGLTTSGGPITTSGTITLAGTLAVANGGTGQTSYTDGQLLIGNSSGNTLSKATLTAGTGVSITNGSGTISIAATNNGTVTSVSGTGTVNGITLTGNVTSSGSLTLGGTLSGVDLTTQVTGDLPYSNLAQGSALSVLGVAGNATADVASIAAATDHQVLRRSGTSLAFGAVNLAQSAAVTGALPIANGGTGATDAGTARTNLSAAASGANSDITSMSSITGGISSPDFIQFDATLSPLPTDATGKIYYDNSDQFQTLSFQMNGNVVQHIGQEQFFRIRCSGSITKGQVVMFAGTIGASGGLIGAAATGLTADQANYILGVADESGINNDWIFVSSFGEVKGINTTGGAESWVQGQILYYNPAVTGGLTKTKPTTPNAIAIVAAVVYVHATNGILFVRPTFGSVLGGTDGNVQFGTLNNGDVIVYDSTDQRWENVAQSGLSVGSATTSTNVAGGSANQIVFNTASSTTSFITAPVTSGHYLKWNGSAFTWDSAGTGSVTSVAMTVPTGLTVSGSPITAAGTLSVTFTAGYSIPTTSSQTNWDTAFTDRLKWDGGSTGLTPSTGRTSLGGTTVGQNLFTLTNPSAITFPRFNADNSVSALSAADFRTAISAGTGNGTVTSITAGTYLTGGTITTSGTIDVDATSANTASKVVARDGSGNFSAGTITASLSGNATSSTNLAGGAASQIPYQTGAGATAFIANGTAGQVLVSAGTSVPAWGGISGGTF